MSEVMSAYVRFFVKDEVSGSVGGIESAATGAADSMDRAAASAGNMGTAAGNAGGGAGRLAAGMGMVAGGVGAAVGGIMGLASASQTTVAEMGKLEVAFTDAGLTTETAQAVYSNMVGVLGDTEQAVEASNHLAMLTSNTEELSTWGDISAGVYAKFGASLPLESLTEAANHTAQLGETQGALADALEWAGMDVDTFNAQLAACATEQERASLITQTLNGIYGEAGQAYQTTNADLIAANQAQSDMSLTMANAGAAVQPLATSLTDLGTTLLTALLPHLTTFADMLQSFIDEKLPGIMTWFESVRAKLAEWQPVFELLAPIAAGVLAGFLAFSAATTVMTTFKTAVDAVKTAQILLNTAMNANPVGIVVGLIAGLVAAFVTAYTTSETFRDTVNGVFDTVSTAVQTAIDYIVGLLDFDWEWPSIPLPHFSVTGSMNPLKWIDEGLPSIGVEWYAKGGVFDRPTLFATGAGLKGVGEAGPEAVAPVSTLMGYIRQAVAEASGGGYVANVNVTTGETDPAKLARMIAREERRSAYRYGLV